MIWDESFYASQNGEIEIGEQKSLRDIIHVLGLLLPEKVVLEDTKQAALREGVFGTNLTEAFYIFRGYNVKFI